MGTAQAQDRQEPIASTDDELGASQGNKGDNPLMAGRPVVQFPPEIAAKLEQERMLGQIVGALASMSWGQRMTPLLRRATAQYCIRYGIDPLTELDMLGGNPYPNSEFYLRKLGELRMQGVVKDFWFDHVNADQELLKTAADQAAPDIYRGWAKAEHWRRWRRRRELGAREEATDICAFHIVLASGGHDIVGWKQAGGGTSVVQRKGDGTARPNPIVEDENNSALSVESQSVRRAVRQISSHVQTPGLMEVARVFAAVDQDATALGERIQESRVDEPIVTPHGATPLQLTEGGYATAEVLDAVQRKIDAEGRPVPAVTIVERGPHEPPKRMQFGNDPYEMDAARERVRPIVEREREGENLNDSPGVATNPDIFGGETPVTQPTKHVCGECKRSVSAPEDHDGDCSHYADPDYDA